MIAAPEPLTLIYFVGLWTILILIIAFTHNKHAGEAEKKLFFMLISIPILLVTIYTAGHTVHHNVTSATGGPVHWHADYQVWACGERLDLIDPSFPSNKIGTPLFHEHDDDRLHVEGTVSDIRTVDLGEYFKTIGGRLTDTQLVYPTNDGVVEVSDGVTCDDQPGTLKTYVNGQRIDDPGDYLYYPHAYVPPGDCIAFIEFSSSDAQTTDKLCESWQAQGWTYDNYEQQRADAGYPSLEAAWEAEIGD